MRQMMKHGILAAAFLMGLLFGLGLLLGGMANPAKVLAFLDVGGAWDPSLAFVMAGAIGVAVLPFAWGRRRAQSLLDAPMHAPKATQIDGWLIGGSVLFGAGWGLAGICPGPALVLVGAGVGQALIFVAAMLVGMVVADVAKAKLGG